MLDYSFAVACQVQACLLSIVHKVLACREAEVKSHRVRAVPTKISKGSRKARQGDVAETMAPLQA